VYSGVPRINRGDTPEVGMPVCLIFITETLMFVPSRRREGGIKKKQCDKKWRYTIKNCKKGGGQLAAQKSTCFSINSLDLPNIPEDCSPTQVIEIEQQLYQSANVFKISISINRHNFSNLLWYDLCCNNQWTELSSVMAMSSFQMSIRSKCQRERLLGSSFDVSIELLNQLANHQHQAYHKFAIKC